MWNSQTWLFINSCLPLWPGDLFFSYWTECSRASHPSRKTACVFKNPENAGMIRKISFQAKSSFLNLQEMFKNSGSVEWSPSTLYTVQCTLVYTFQEANIIVWNTRNVPNPSLWTVQVQVQWWGSEVHAKLIPNDYIWLSFPYFLVTGFLPCKENVVVKMLAVFLKIWQFIHQCQLRLCPQV